LKKSEGYYISAPTQERAYLVGVHIRGSSPLLSVDESLDELTMLAETANMAVVGRTHQVLNQIDVKTFIGSGKLDEIYDTVLDLDAHTVIFDDELSPRHQRELEKRFGDKVKVIDRSTLILDIFAQHARTKEGALQIELAQYEYRLPRLTRQWTHLARQAGGGGSRSGNAGVGLRGPGETQLEVDKREIGRKITKLKSDIEQVRRHRERYRHQRVKDKVAVISLVGYTNAGKSTLFRSLTGANVYTADQLFATLDPTTRKLNLPSGRQVVLTDTVGFIQKLPTTLIIAFHATLEEISEADVILHVVDLSHPHAAQHYETVEDTLAELDVPSIPKILVGNKSDKLSDEEATDKLNAIMLDETYKDRVAVSALKENNLDNLLSAVEKILLGLNERATLLIPYNRGDITALLHEEAMIVSQEHTEDGIILDVYLSNDLYQKFAIYKTRETT
jgi:GTP-binding protein HflX